MGVETRQGYLTRRNFIVGLGALAVGATALGFGLSRGSGENKDMVMLYTFGDSILDCGHYNAQGVHPGQLLVRNDDQLFPEFKGKDLASRGPARLEHRAQDGATVSGLPGQARGLRVEGPAVAIMTIGGNDLITGLAVDSGAGIERFAQALRDFLEALPIRPVYIGNVYDPSFGNDANNFLGVDPALARANHGRINSVIAELGQKYGAMVDLHAHFLTGDPSWYTHTIEPSLRGASEVRRAFSAHVLG